MVALVSAATGPVSRPASNGRGLQSRHSAMDRRTGRAPVMHARSPNDNRSDQMNPNNPAYTDSRGGSGGHDDNHADQLNPNNPQYGGSSQDQPGGNDDNRANQLNPNNSK